MEFAKVGWEVAIVFMSAALGALARYAHAIRDSDGMLCGTCTINWRALFMEVPGVLACGLTAAGLCYAVGWTHPLVLAGVATVFGHVGFAAALGLVLRFVPPPPKRD